MKAEETAYQSRSPSPSRKSLDPKVLHGNLPTTSPRQASEEPSSLMSGHGKSPGRACPVNTPLLAADPIRAALASAKAAAVFFSRSILMPLPSNCDTKNAVTANTSTKANIINTAPFCFFLDRLSFCITLNY